MCPDKCSTCTTPDNCLTCGKYLYSSPECLSNYFYYIFKICAHINVIFANLSMFAPNVLQIGLICLTVPAPLERTMMGLSRPVRIASQSAKDVKTLLETVRYVPLPIMKTNLNVLASQDSLTMK
jgi:hypothetical protein